MINTNGVIVQTPKFLAAYDGGDTVLFPLTGPEGFTDTSAVPGAATHKTWRGRAAIAAAGSSVVVTNPLITANSTVLPILAGGDATALYARATVAAGQVTFTLNAAATGIVKLDYIVIGV